MADFFALNPVWDEKQLEALNAKPDIIISGCAGSGKTLIAIHLAKRLYEESESLILILTYTVALYSFIKQTLRRLGVSDDVEVMYEAQFRRLERKRELRSYEYIIVDEAQDFSVQDIDELQNLSSQGIYVFGDDKQQLYPKNFADVKNLNLENLQYQLDFRSIQLKKNYRISQLITDFILELYPNSFLTESTTASSKLQKPLILQLSTRDQLDWIKDYVTKREEDIGILVKRNESNNKQPSDKSWIPGIRDIVEYLSEDRANIGYKYYDKNTSENFDELNFDDDFNVNVLTLHSSKGLQFDTVIIPFDNGNIDDVVYYVGMTRAKSKLIILYSDRGLSGCFRNSIDTNKYEGQIKSAWVSFEEIRKRYKEE